MPYYISEPVPLTFTLTDANGNPVQAAATPPVCTVTLPDESTQTPTVTFAGGEYTATGPSSQAGHYQVEWECTDATYPGGDTDSYDISPEIESSILSLAEARRALRISATDDSEDDFIIEFSRSVTDIVEWYCGPVLQQTVVEELRAGGLVVQLSKPPVLGLVTWTSVPAALQNASGFSVASANSGPMFPTMVYGVAYPLNQLYCDPVKGRVNHTSGLPFYYGPFLWQYSAGRVVVPDCIRTGSKAILKHIFGMERGGAGGSGSMAADEETTQTPFGFAVPNRALEIMASQAIPAAIA